MPFPIDLQKIMARTQILVKNSDFFTNGLILVIHIIYQLLVMIWKLLHHLKHPTGHCTGSSCPGPCPRPLWNWVSDKRPGVDLF